MSKTALVKKLRIQPGQRVLIMSAPQGYFDELGDLPEGVEVAGEPDGTFDFVQLFVKNLAEVGGLGPAAVEAVKHDGLLWISYPKRSSKVETDLSRDVLRKVIAKMGLRPVALVSVNDVWSSMRFRPAEKVGK